MKQSVKNISIKEFIENDILFDLDEDFFIKEDNNENINIIKFDIHDANNIAKYLFDEITHNDFITSIDFSKFSLESKYDILIKYIVDEYVDEFTLEQIKDIVYNDLKCVFKVRICHDDLHMLSRFLFDIDNKLKDYIFEYINEDILYNMIQDMVIPSDVEVYSKEDIINFLT